MENQQTQTNWQGMAEKKYHSEIELFRYIFNIRAKQFTIVNFHAITKK
jgi:hypothetical protein